LNLIRIIKGRVGKTITKEISLNLEKENVKFLKKLFERVSEIYPLGHEEAQKNYKYCL
jgi:hypothetical protein